MGYPGRDVPEGQHQCEEESSYVESVFVANCMGETIQVVECYDIVNQK